MGERLSHPQRALMSWFGIRGVGSVIYLLLALHLGVDGPVANTLVSLTLWTVAASIVAHGLTAQPLMQRYLIWRGAKRQRRGAKRDSSCMQPQHAGQPVRCATVLQDRLWPVFSGIFKAVAGFLYLLASLGGALIDSLARLLCWAFRLLAAGEHHEE
jgi:hypothetical protein